MGNFPGAETDAVAHILAPILELSQRVLAGLRWGAFLGLGQQLLEHGYRIIENTARNRPFFGGDLRQGGQTVQCFAKDGGQQGGNAVTVRGCCQQMWAGGGKDAPASGNPTGEQIHCLIKIPLPFQAAQLLHQRLHPLPQQDARAHHPALPHRDQGTEGLHN